MKDQHPRYSRGNYQDKWRLERHARLIREQLGFTQLDIFDPWRLADALPAHVFFVDDVVGPELASRAHQADWDGLAFQFPQEPTLMVIMNPARPPARQSATLMEELSHGLLRHEPTRLVQDPVTGLLRREYNKAQEDEAYDLGATILLPKELIQQEVTFQTPAADIAQTHQCSIQLVTYRIKRCRLWQRFVGAGALVRNRTR